jgi:hypothetical protein
MQDGFFGKWQITEMGECDSRLLRQQGANQESVSHPRLRFGAFCGQDTNSGNEQQEARTRNRRRHEAATRIRFVSLIVPG